MLATCSEMHGYFSAEKFLVLASVKLARHFITHSSHFSPLLHLGEGPSGARGGEVQF
jgi:hypothetical protein